MPPMPSHAFQRRHGLTRQAAAQRADEAPSSRILDRKTIKVGATDPSYQQNYQAWQDHIRRYAHVLGVVRFAASIVADTSGRCRLTVEERKPNGEWDEYKGKDFQGFFDNYRNPMQGPEELLRRHAWYYQTVGEMLQVVKDGDEGVEWFVYSANAVTFQRDSAVVQDIPNGTLRDGTAWRVPRNYVTRFWIPDEEWFGYATSPMGASLEALHRYYSLARYARRTADSALAMNGILFTPSEAHRRAGAGPTGPRNAAAGRGSGTDLRRSGSGGGDVQAGSKLDRDIVAMAQVRLDDDESVASVIPFPMHYDSQYAKPEWIKIADGLDPHGIEYRREALEDFARGVNLPQSLVVGGGGGSEGNHWSEWLVDERYFHITVAPVMDRVCHLDLTRSMLVPFLRYEGEKDLRRFRVSYDPQDVIVRPDQSGHALALHLAGLLKGDLALEAANWNAEDRMDDKELAQVLDIVSKGKANAEPAPSGSGVSVTPGAAIAQEVKPAVGPGNVAKQPPPPGGAKPPAPKALPPAPPAAGGPPAKAAAVAANRTEQASGVPLRAERIKKATKLMTKLADIQSRTGRKLVAAADVAFASAIKKAGVKVKTRGTGRKLGKERMAPVTAAVSWNEAVLAEGHVLGLAALSPHLGAVGITEAELLSGSFDEYQTQAKSWLRQMLIEQKAALEDSGLEVDTDIGSNVDEYATDASAYMTAAMLALAWNRIQQGHPLLDDPGEVSGFVPAKFAREAIAVASGAASVVPGATPDQFPDLIPVEDKPDVAAAIADAVRGDGGDGGDGTDTTDAGDGEGEPDTVYEWVHAFYGDPKTDFEPHLNLDGYTTTNIEDDPELANDDWTDGDFYHPDDHDGCTCEWVATIQARYAQNPARERIEGRNIPGLGGTPDQIQQALDAAGVSE